jgi:hypothetical protein
MHLTALATDGDGTLLEDGKMSDRTATAIGRARTAGVSILLVTGETKDELEKFPRPELIDFIVAENGALLLDPKAKLKETLLGKTPPVELLARLKAAGLKDLTVGHSIISLDTRHEALVNEIVESLNCGWRVIRNRHDVMLLPPGIDKASGLKAALRHLNIASEQVVAVGDAENDYAMFKFARVGVAVSSAVQFLKKRADHVTRGGAGDGIVELIDLILRDALMPVTRAAVQ